ncbi:MAG: roadblock/LC7 domain-containing protein [Candidatus Helarchaeota archaeon]|nr:roadblock/LC7 domain-containing protein [Candidatus Helarchaeota archaeon]
MSGEIIQEVKRHLVKIKKIYGVENIVLSQRDGSPIESAGIWLSKNEIFGVCSSTAAIFNVAEHLHKNSLNYILIDGIRAKILVAPLRNSDKSMLFNGLQTNNSNSGNNFKSETEYFIAITTRPKTNLGSIFIGMKKSLHSISKILDESGLEFKPPLRSFSEEEVKNILESFSVKEDDEISSKITTFSLKVTAELSSKIRDLVFDYSKNVPGVKVACITLSGGYPLCKFTLDPVIEAEGAISFSLFDTSKRIIYMLKKTPINSVLCECANYSHFIYDLSGGIFSTFISKGEKRLGLLRLLIPQYVKQMTGYLREADKTPEEEFNIKQILEELNI